MHDALRVWPRCSQGHFDEHLTDTEVDAPLANLQLHHLQVRCQQQRQRPHRWYAAQQQPTARSSLQSSVFSACCNFWRLPPGRLQPGQ
jgi:hypothetical protein